MTSNSAGPWIFLAISLFGCPRPAQAPDAGSPQPAITREADMAALPQVGGSLADQLAAEANGRPKNGLTIEAVAAYLTQKGHTLSPLRQSQARAWRARYCAALTVDGLIVTVYEYSSEAHASRASEDFKALQANMSTAALEVVGPSIVTLVSTSPEGAALRDALRPELKNLKNPQSAPAPTP